jgi:hypothetical protein
LAFNYDGLGCWATRTVSGNRADYWYDMMGLTQETGPGSLDLTYLRDPDGLLLSTTTGGATYNYGRDRLTSTPALVTTGGGVANTYTYMPYGDINTSSGTVYSPFRFTASYYDTESVDGCNSTSGDTCILSVLAASQTD